ncbi:MAG TPA: FAD-dependent monooxygenase [Rectinemataceae bacterium]|nr:FAD-dependent monooxygenase [Rectinemataceae bacterium]
MALYRINQISLPLGASESALERRVAEILRLRPGDLAGFRIERRSVDARDKRDLRLVYGVVAETKEGARQPEPAGSVQRVEATAGYAFSARGAELDHRPVVVGAGPAGLFCALMLAEWGLRPLVLERGDDVEARGRAVAAFFGGGPLDPESNIQFGEGGAGTYSDGKLTTQVNDPGRRNLKVIEEFLEAGAPAEIAYSSKPHIGTDYLVRVVRNIRAKIEGLGGELRFRSRVEAIELEGEGASALRVSGLRVTGSSETIATRTIVLALGHSARDSFSYLASIGLPMEQKSFAIGLRIEHPQEMISRSQYGESWRHPALPAADYKLTHRSAGGRGVYSFCMCPGGAVVNASSEAGMVACNGMSDFGRGGRNANSAVVVTVGPEDFRGFAEGSASPEVLAGMEFQRRWEAAAFEQGGGAHAMPVQLCGDFLAGRRSSGLGAVEPDIRGRYALADLSLCLPGYVAAAIGEGIRAFDRKVRGFARADAPLSGVETRTSSPVRMLRDESCQSSVRGIYPCGEGAGYAGGIMSSAMDGIRVAEAIAGAAIAGAASA